MRSPRPSLLPSFGVVGLLFIFSAGYVLWLGREPEAILINDTGVELMQVRAMDLWPPRALIESYPGGLVDVIESAVPYAYKLSAVLLGDRLFTYRLFMSVVWGLSVVLLYRISLRWISPLAALLAAAVLATSAYPLWLTLILTRNGATFLVACWWWMEAFRIVDESTPRRPWRLFWPTLAGLLTYTSFKFFLPVGFAVLAWKIHRARPGYGRSVALVGGVAALVLLILLLPFEDAVGRYFIRGNYVAESFDPNQHWATRSGSFVLHSLALPFTHTNEGFLAEPAHRFFDRGVLQPLLWIFFGLGLVRIVTRARDRAKVGWAFLVGLITLMILAMGGPSLKTLYIIAPLVFLALAGGVDWAIGGSSKIASVGRTLAVTALVMVSAVFDFRHLTSQVIPQVRHDSDSYALGLHLAKYEQDFVHVTCPAVDLFRLGFPQFLERSQFAFSSEEFLAAFDQPVTSARAVHVAPEWDPVWERYQARPNHVALRREIGGTVYRFIYRTPTSELATRP